MERMRSLIPHCPSRVLASLWLLITLTCIPWQAADAAQANPPLYVTVDGVRLSYRRVLDLSGLAIEGTGAFQLAVKKPSTQMPTNAALFYYDGTDLHGKPIVWISNAYHARAKQAEAADAELQREEMVAALLVMLGAGKGGSDLQRLYRKASSTAESRQRLGVALENAIERMSEKVVHYSSRERRWIFAHLTAGMPRARVLQLLRTQSLTVKSGSVPATHDGRQTLLVNLPGTFEPGCYFSSNITIAFDASVRLYKIDLSQPIPDCL